jgi:Flp pilus assembly protein TadD
VNALVFGDLPVAYAHVRKALEIDPHEAYLLSNLGIILKRNGQLEDAARAFETALQCDPDQPVPLNNLYYLHHLAENLMEERRYHEAIDLLEKAIRIEDEEYRFHYALAQSQFEVGLQQPARASLQRAIELVPDQQGTVRLTLPEGS